MRFKLISFAMILVAAVVFVACNAVDHAVNTNPKPSTARVGPETTYPDGARRITPAELETMMKNGQVFVVDVRNQAMFDTGHIPGSRLIPSNEILNHVNELPRDKMIVTYCS